MSPGVNGKSHSELRSIGVSQASLNLRASGTDRQALARAEFQRSCRCATRELSERGEIPIEERRRRRKQRDGPQRDLNEKCQTIAYKSVMPVWRLRGEGRKLSPRTPTRPPRQPRAWPRYKLCQINFKNAPCHFAPPLSTMEIALAIGESLGTAPTLVGDMSNQSRPAADRIPRSLRPAAPQTSARRPTTQSAARRSGSALLS